MPNSATMYRRVGSRKVNVDDRYVWEAENQGAGIDYMYPKGSNEGRGGEVVNGDR